MSKYQEQYSQFGLNERLKEAFLNFETLWGTRDSSVKPYSIVSVGKSKVSECQSVKAEIYAELV